MEEIKVFEKEKKQNQETMRRDERFSTLSLEWLQTSVPHKYSYNFSWAGIPIIQYPTDIIQMQELVWEIKPDLIIEIGIAHGGGAILYASLLELIGKEGHVLGIDIDIREHNRIRIEQHPLKHRITLMEGSSIAEDTIDKVKEFAKDYKKVMLVLDSNHTHSHVLEELKVYADLVSINSYMIVFDTLVEFMPEDFYEDRPWSIGDNPYTAVQEFMEMNDAFEIDKDIDKKLMISAAPQGWLKRVK